MKAFGITDIGKVRSENQDSFAIHDMSDCKICVVCDGMGGERAGNIASEVACDSFVSHIVSRRADMADKALVNEATHYANIKTYDRAFSDFTCEGMGTTLVGGIFEPDIAYIAHVGDSRAYMCSRGVLWQITTDHSYVEELVAQGKITRAQAKVHPRRNYITRALGIGRETACDVFTVDVKKDDVIILCSDGLTNMVTDIELHDIAVAEKSAEKICRALVELALTREATDNITAVVIEF